MKQQAVLKVSHLPDGLNEKSIRDYLTQFGTVGRIYLPRSLKTLRNRGFAFVSMPSEIASIAAETLNKKLMFNKVVKCEIITDPKKTTFRNKRLWRETSTECLRRDREAKLGEPVSKTTIASRKKKLSAKLKALQTKNPSYKFTEAD